MSDLEAPLPVKKTRVPWRGVDPGVRPAGLSGPPGEMPPGPSFSAGDASRRSSLGAGPVAQPAALLPGILEEPAPEPRQLRPADVSRDAACGVTLEGAEGERVTVRVQTPSESFSVFKHTALERPRSRSVPRPPPEPSR